MPFTIWNKSQKNRFCPVFSDSMAHSYSQIYTFILYSAVIGFVFGCVYDALRLIRTAFYMAGKKVLTNVIYFTCDVLFFIIIAVASAIFIFHVNNGRIRGIAIFGSLAGFTVYYNTVGRLTSAVYRYIIKGVYRVLRFIWETVLLAIWHFCVGVGDSIYTRRHLKRRIRSFKRKGC